MPGFGQCVGFEKLSVTTSAGFIAIPVYPNGDPACNAAVIRVTGQNAHVRMDGVAPTITVGFPMMTNDAFLFPILGWGNIKNFLAIADTGTAVVSALYYQIKSA